MKAFSLKATILVSLVFVIFAVNSQASVNEGDLVLLDDQTATQQLVKRFAANELEVELIFNVQRDGLTAADEDKLSAKMRGERYLDLVKEVTEFAIGEYSRRGWPEEFKRSLIAKAIDTAPNSSYVIIRKDQKIIGSMRITYSPYQVFARNTERQIVGIDRFPTCLDLDDRGTFNEWFERNHPAPLPAEQTLGLRLARPSIVKVSKQWWKVRALFKNADQACSQEQIKSYLKELNTFNLSLGVLIEPASFAIDRSLPSRQREHVSDLILAGMSELLMRHKIIFGGKPDKILNLPALSLGAHRIFVTYGDPLSVRFYRILGYHESADSSPKDFRLLTSTAFHWLKAGFAHRDRLKRMGLDFGALVRNSGQGFVEAQSEDFLVTLGSPIDQTSSKADCEANLNSNQPL